MVVEIDEPGFAGCSERDRRAGAVLAEVVAADAGAGVEAAGEEGAQRGEVAGAERLVEACLTVATTIKGGDTGLDAEAEGVVAVAVGEVVDGVDEIVGVGGGGAGEAATGDFFLIHRERVSVLIVLFVAIVGAGNGAEGGVPKGECRIVDDRSTPAGGLIAVGGEGGGVGEEELFEARIRNRGVGRGGMGEHTVDVDEDGAGIHAQGAGR